MTQDFSLDQIGKRLRGEVSGHDLILAEDDKARVQWIVSQFDRARNVSLLDIGASDGSIALHIAAACAYARMPAVLMERHPAHYAALLRLSAETGWHLCTADLRTALDQMPSGFSDALLCEVLEHLSHDEAVQAWERTARRVDRIVVTVPNANCVSYLAEGRSRRDWPDHKQHFTADSLAAFMGVPAFQIQPIVGTLNDSIWLGAVWER